MNPPRASRLGLTLFVFYLLLYLGFVLIAAFSPSLMEWRPFDGLNLAILYGFGLIGIAILLALIYGAFTKTRLDDSVGDATRGPVTNPPRSASETPS